MDRRVTTPRSREFRATACRAFNYPLLWGHWLGPPTTKKFVVMVWVGCSFQPVHLAQTSSAGAERELLKFTQAFWLTWVRSRANYFPILTASFRRGERSDAVGGKGE